MILERGRVVTTGAPSDLRTEHGSAALHVRVAAAQAERAADLVADLGHDVTAVAGGFDVAIHDDSDSAAVVRTLVEHGVEVFEARREQTSLEDVYLRLHAAGDAALADLPPPATGAT